MRASTLLTAAVIAVCSVSRAEAGPLTITWQGDWTWYNGDHRNSCISQGSPDYYCSFYSDMESLGIQTIAGTNQSDALVTLALTLEGSTLVNGTSFGAPTSVGFSAAAVEFNGSPYPLFFNTSPDDIFIYGRMDPTLNPILGKWQPFFFQMWIEGLGLSQAPAGSVDSIATMLLHNGATTHYCLALASGDCDVYGQLHPVSVTHAVPELTPLVYAFSSLGSGLFLLYWRRRRHAAAAPLN